MLSIITMNPNAAAETEFQGTRSARRSQTDLLVESLTTEFPTTTSCEIRVAVLQAEEDLWPKKDEYIVLDHARDLLRRGPAVISE